MKIQVLVKAKARQGRVEKAENGYRVYVKAPPAQNQANKAVIKALSGYFGIPISRISIFSGFKARQKIIEIAP